MFVVEIGQEITLTVEVGTRGPDPATDLTVIIKLPAAVDVVTSKTALGKCRESADSVVCDMANLDAGSIT